MSIPTRGEEYAKLIEHNRKAQESAAMLAHIVRDESRVKAEGWLAVSEAYKLLGYKIGQLATKGLN
jgi:hypothetical protein